MINIIKCVLSLIIQCPLEIYVIDKNFKSLCNLLWIFETRIAITIMTNQHQRHNCEEDITILDIIKIIAQP